MQVRGYLDSHAVRRAIEPDDEALDQQQITADLYQRPARAGQPRRSRTPARMSSCYAARLRDMCEVAGHPNEFFPHHGSLARELREEAEAALKDRGRPATAVATTTLEMGIDIGSVQSVAQLGRAAVRGGSASAPRPLRPARRARHSACLRDGAVG